MDTCGTRAFAWSPTVADSAPSAPPLSVTPTSSWSGGELGGGGEAGGGEREASIGGAGGGEGGSLRKATDKRRIPLAVSCKTDGCELGWFKSEGNSPLRHRVGAWR
eukprot:scaffold41488_cov62-Phaeocystis_antarctica.AAC.3